MDIVTCQNHTSHTQLAKHQPCHEPCMQTQWTSLHDQPTPHALSLAHLVYKNSQNIYLAHLVSKNSQTVHLAHIQSTITLKLLMTGTSLEFLTFCFTRHFGISNLNQHVTQGQTLPWAQKWQTEW